MQDYVGKQIDRYHIVERQGTGGMAVVYRAYDTRLEREVALKLIRTASIPPDQYDRLLKRFEREAKAQAKFQHPNIVQVYDYGEMDGAPYLVMEYVSGGTLKERVGTPIDYRQAVRLLLPIADALRYAHERGVIHRDIKPSNILMNEEQRPMLTDFGIAKLLETDEQTLTGTGMGVGTPEYMAPEQWHGKATPQTDMYALGVVFYELITGAKPYQADTPAAVAILQATEPLKRPGMIIQNLPTAVEQFLFKALARDPQDRFEDMLAYKQSLLGLMDADAAADDPSSLPPGEGETFDQLAVPSHETMQDPGTTVNPLPGGEETILPRKPVMAVKEKVATNVSYPENPAPLKPQMKKRFPMWVVYAGLAVILVGAAIGIGSRLVDLGTEGTGPLSGLATETATVTRTATATVTKTTTPTKNSTPSRTFTSTVSPTATLGIGSTMLREKDGMEMVYIPAGSFTMGSEDGEDDEKPMHEVYLDAYWIDKFEVTNAKYEQCVEYGGCNSPYSVKSLTRSSYYRSGDFADYPVIYLNWWQAQSYCEWVGGSLPTEAQWEKAARGTDGRIYPWGDESPTCNLANFYGCVGDTNEVGSYLDGASPYGAMDMSGNVWEWVADLYDDGYYNSRSVNPTGPMSGSHHVLRGGSWDSIDSNLRTASRRWYYPLNAWYYSNIGVRCVLSP